MISVVLSGLLDDGTSGSAAVKAGGGVVVVQALDDALYPSMPASVLESVGADHVASAEDLGPLIERLVREGAEPKPREIPMTHHPKTQDDDLDEDPEAAPSGPASAFTCPECHGALWELRDHETVRYRCRVGHAYAPESLMAHQGSHVGDALWTAYRALEESAALAKRLGERARRQGLDEVAKRYEERRTDAEGRAKTIRAALEPPDTGTSVAVDE